MDRPLELKSMQPGVAGLPSKRDRNHEDDFVLTRMGKRPVLKRNFGLMSMLGFSCTVMITWEGVLILLAVNLLNGGLAGSVYGYVIVWLGAGAAFSTMAELSSMAPTAAGQYHWVSILAPQKSRIFLSYIVGWLTMIGWHAITASGGFLCAQFIQGLIILGAGDAGYTPQPFQAMLLYWAVIMFSVIINTVVARLLPKLESFILILHIFGFVGIFITLLYFGPHGDATEIFTSFSNGGGWPSQGLSFLVGMVGPAFSLLGPDSVVHMSEEIKNPEKNIPRAIVFGFAINGLLGFAMLLAALFCLGDLDTVLQSPTGYPFLAILQQAVGSTSGTLAMGSIVIIMNISATMSFVATASRLTWSFARDRGLPGWNTLRKVEARSTLPIWSIALTSVIAILLSLIILGSSIAFNDVISLSINGLYASYLIGNSLLLWRRVTGQIQSYTPSRSVLTNTSGSDQLTWGPWRIPEPLGTIVNVFGCAYLALEIFFTFWPPAINPGAAGMNYSSLMVGSVVIFSLIYYFAYGRRVFSGPVIEVNPVEDMPNGHV